MIDQSNKHNLIDKLSSPGAELSFPSWSLHRSSPAGLVRAPPDGDWGLPGRQNQQNAAHARSSFFVRPRRGVDFIGFADNFENSGANEREAERKCKGKETLENGRPGHSSAVKSYEARTSLAGSSDSRPTIRAGARTTSWCSKISLRGSYDSSLRSLRPPSSLPNK